LESETGCTVLIPSNIYLTWFYCEHELAETAHSTARRKYAPLKHVYLKCIFSYQVLPLRGFLAQVDWRDKWLDVGRACREVINSLNLEGG